MERDATAIDQASTVLGALARRDVSGLSDEVLVAEHEAVARLSRLAGALQSRYDSEIARRSSPEIPGGGLARAAGHGNVDTMISRVTGGSVAGTRRSIEAGQALTPMAGSDGGGAPASRDDGAAASPASAAPRFPVVAEASLAGELSVEAAGLITTGLTSVTDRIPADDLHAMERRLVDKAKSLSAHEVRRLVARAVARVDHQGTLERERRQYEERYLTWSEDHTGMVTFSGRLDAVTAAPIRNTIEQWVTSQFRARRDQDPTERDQRTVGQMRADALADLCRHAAGCKETEASGIRTTLVVRMDLKDLNAGQGWGTIDGTGQLVSVEQLRRLAGDSGIVPEVLGGEGEVLDLGRTTRLFTRAQRLALLERDGGCAKCHAPPEHCEAHHIRWWEHGGGSDLGNGVMLCTRCHHDIHRYGWDIVVHANRVLFLPPPTVDPQQRPRLGGSAAIDLADLSPPAERNWYGERDWYAEDHFVDDEAMIRRWMHADAYA